MGSAEPTVDVTLKGAPDGMPETVRIPVTALSADRLKIPFRAGYEHFVPDVNARSETGIGAVFLWCDRTKLAE